MIDDSVTIRKLRSHGVHQFLFFYSFFTLYGEKDRLDFEPSERDIYSILHETNLPKKAIEKNGAVFYSRYKNQFKNWFREICEKKLETVSSIFEESYVRPRHNRIPTYICDILDGKENPSVDSIRCALSLLEHDLLGDIKMVRKRGHFSSEDIPDIDLTKISETLYINLMKSVFGKKLILLCIDFTQTRNGLFALDRVRRTKSIYSSRRRDYDTNRFTQLFNEGRSLAYHTSLVDILCLPNRELSDVSYREENLYHYNSDIHVLVSLLISL